MSIRRLAPVILALLGLIATFCVYEFTPSHQEALYGPVLIPPPTREAATLEMAEQPIEGVYWQPPTTTSTTIYTPPSPTISASPKPQTQEWGSDLQPCGGDLPPCYVKARESGGNYSAKNPSSSASGAWQFLDSTWAGFEGYASAYLAPPSVQDEKARQLWAGGAGCSHWSAC